MIQEFIATAQRKWGEGGKDFNKRICPNCGRKFVARHNFHFICSYDRQPGKASPCYKAWYAGMFRPRVRD